jgi:hypothetical protein
MSIERLQDHDERQDADGDPHLQLGANIVGALIMIAGSIAVVAFAWGALVAMTSPNGWISIAADKALSGEAVTLTSFADASTY